MQESLSAAQIKRAQSYTNTMSMQWWTISILMAIPRKDNWNPNPSTDLFVLTDFLTVAEIFLLAGASSDYLQTHVVSSKQPRRRCADALFGMRHLHRAPARYARFRESNQKPRVEALIGIFCHWTNILRGFNWIHIQYLRIYRVSRQLVLNFDFNF